MRVMWFGQAWTESDAACDPEFKISTPVDTRCIECDKHIKEGDRGLVTACSPGIWGHWECITPDGGHTLTVCSYHLACFLAIVAGDQIEGTRVAERMTGVGKQARQTEIYEGAEHVEDAEPGGGWGE